MEIRIRKLRPADLPAVGRLVHKTIATSYADCYSRPVIAWFIEQHSLEHILDDARRGYTVVAIRGGRLVGTGTLLGTEIRRVFVRPSCQGRGVGRQIMRRLLRRAKTNGLRKVTLHSSLPARRFYEALGFEVVWSGKIRVGRGGLLRYHDMVMPLAGRRARKAR